MKGYIKVPELSKNGKQHLHVLFRGSYVDQQLLSHWWQELHKAKVVDIRKAGYGRGKRGIAADMASYMAKDNNFRYSWNWDWVWRGFVADWKRLKKLVYSYYGGYQGPGLHALLHLWHRWLRGNWKPDFTLLPEPP